MPDSSPRLELLVPWELPIEQCLSATQQFRVERALQQLLQALEQPEAVALSLVNQALVDFGTVSTSPAQIGMSKTPLKSPQIAEFDDYFEAIHVESSEPAACLVRSLLITYQRLLSLWLQADRLNLEQFEPAQVEQQKQGLLSYVYLLGRVFQLESLSDPAQEESL